MYVLGEFCACLHASSSDNFRCHLEYLIYHLRPFGVDTSELRGIGGADMSLLSRAYLAAVRNQGADDAFKKTEKDVPSLASAADAAATSNT